LFESLKLLTVCIILFSLMSYLGIRHRYFELFSHFKVQYLAILLFCAFMFILQSQWLWLMISLVGVCLNGFVILPWYFPIQSQIGISDHHLKIIQANVHWKNQNDSALIKLVTTEQPDILIVQEVSRFWKQKLKLLNKQFPYMEIYSDKDKLGLEIELGIAVLSRFPFEYADVFLLGRAKRETLLVGVKINQKILSLVTTHPWAPISQKLFDLRNEQLTAVTTLIQKQPTPKILVGDFNTSLWSPYYTRLIQNTGLVNARQGFGILPTYPTFFSLLMIPIDHCLVSPDIKVINIKTGKNIGSDHLPLIIEISICFKSKSKL
jgi:endonuclease/exonuclease/phosphatase (EEP) superfamily protein YafD